VAAVGGILHHDKIFLKTNQDFGFFDSLRSHLGTLFPIRKKRAEDMGTTEDVVNTVTVIGKIFIFVARLIGYAGWFLETLFKLSTENISRAASAHPITTTATIIVLLAICILSTYLLFKGIKAFVFSGLMVCLGVVVLIIGGLYVTRYWANATGVFDSRGSGSTADLFFGG
jgi:uncharacterized protein YacL